MIDVCIINLCSVLIPIIRYLRSSHRAPDSNVSSLYQRGLSSMAVKTALAHNPEKHWLDYTFHNQVQSFVLLSCKGVNETTSRYRCHSLIDA